MQAQKIKELVSELSAPLIEEMNLELVDVELVRERGQLVLRVLIDHPGGVSLAHCERLNRYLSDELDRVDPIEQSYTLEVSSAGLERPLKKAQDYVRFAGREASIRLYSPVNGQKKYKGILRGLEENYVLLEDEKKQVHKLPFDLVAKANLVYTLPE